MKTSRPIRTRIDPAAWRHNYQLVRRHAPAAKAWAVIKANAYGHGLWRAVAALGDLADGFAVLEVETAVALREAGVRQPILLLEGVFAARDMEAVMAHRLTAVVHCREQLDLMLGAAPADFPLAIYLKLNTGMNRLGFAAAKVPEVLTKLRQRPAVATTLMTHFAEGDSREGVAQQMERFRALAGTWPGGISLANSACILDHPDTHGDWVRPGIMLYGASPFADRSAAELGLAPVMTLESRIIAIQRVEAGEQVGYSGLFTARAPTRVGIVACGYADGYPRHAPTGTPIAVMGRHTRTLGRVSMDMLACDITDIPEAGVGTPVTLWGRGVAGEVAADEVAAAAGTIAYELFCALSSRVPVEMIGDRGGQGD